MRVIYQISALVLAATPAMAKDAYFVGPIYSQLVSVLAPSDFTPGFEHEADGFYILELTPAGETVENWTQLITITGSKDAARRSDIYTVQWAAHGPATDKLPEPDPAIWTPRFQALAATLICDKVAGEKPPYAPCTQ